MNRWLIIPFRECYRFNTALMKQMQLHRLARLSDLIFAVAMTLMALNFAPLPLQEMTPQEITAFLQQQLPSFGVFAITFLAIAFYWTSPLSHSSRLEALGFIPGVGQQRF
ncbi:MAG: DUF1211 domain-containing protein [Pseudanabaenales cyanobacterium]|nr:DUF1211 domain-containing protein [Pseudanabaenales cyanobacterium]